MGDIRTVLLAGVVTRIQADDPLLAAAVLDALGDCPPAAGPPELRIVEATEPPTVPAEDPDEEYLAVRVWRRAGVLFLAWGDVLTARVDDRELALARTGTTAGDVTRAVRQVLPYALGHLFGARGQVVLHAGAVLVDGAAVLVLGSTGAGKSTLVFAVRSAGRRVLADDLVVVMLDDGALEVTGVPRPLALAADGPEGLPAGARTIGDDIRGRWQFPLDGASGSHPLARVVVVEHATSPSGHLEPMTPAALWDVVLGSFIAAPEPSMLRAAFPALAAVSRLPGWRLGLGSEPATRLRVAAGMLDEISLGVPGSPR